MNDHTELIFQLVAVEYLYDVSTIFLMKWLGENSRSCDTAS